MDTLEHPLPRALRRNPVGSLLLALMAVAVCAAIGWIFYVGYRWLVIILTEAALAYALVATLSRTASPPGAIPPFRSVDH